MVKEPQTAAEMAALQKSPDLMELLLQQRAEPSQRWGLVHNLLFQGRHEDARAVANDPDQHALIDSHKRAVEMPDDVECGCEHQPTALQPLKHAETGRCWSEKDEGFRVFYRCEYCGHTNARLIPPTVGHDKLAMLRKQAAGGLNTGMDRAGRATAAEAVKSGRMVGDGECG